MTPQEAPDSKAAAHRPFRHADHEREWTRAESLAGKNGGTVGGALKKLSMVLAHQNDDDMKPQ